MRIGVDIRCLMDGKRTGVEEYTLGLVHAMTHIAPNDTFVLFANSQRPMQLPAFSGSNVSLQTFTYPNKLFHASLALFEWPPLDTLLRGIDVFFAPSVRRVALSGACPLVTTFHDLSFVRHPHYFSPHRRAWHIMMNPRKLATASRAIIAVSDATADDIVDLYDIPRTRIHTIPSGIRSHISFQERTSGDVRRVQEVYNLPSRFLLYLGTLEPRKNLRGLLDAYTAIRAKGHSHHLVLAGVRGWIDERFFQEASAHPYAQDIHFTGFIRDEDKPALYSLADLFVYPSFYEGFGFPPLEALACGTPVVTSYNAAIPEVVGEYATLVNPYDTVELAAALHERLQHATARIPTNLQIAVRKAFQWEHAARATLRVLHETAASWKEEP